jgi:DNA polymerase III subunit delta
MLEAQIGKGKIDPVYLLCGDAMLAQRVVAALVDKVVTPATRAFNHDVMEGKAAGPTAILNASRTVPMMAAKRLVVVRDVDAMNSENLGELIPYLEDPSPSTVLVMLATKADGRLKFFQIAKKRGVLHEMEVPRQLAPWIREEATRHGAKMGEDAVRRLSDVAGGELGRLASAIEQLALYCDGRPITAADVDELIAETRERTVFELTDAMAQGERERALRSIGKLFDQRESSVGLAMMLARHMRQLAMVKELITTGASPRDIPRLAGVPPFAVDRLIAQARRWPPRSITLGFALLAQADRDLKGPVKGALGERIVVERLVGELIDLQQ